VTDPAAPAVVRVDGELDISRKAELRSKLEAAGEARAVLLDCSEVTYADSTALAELLRFCEQKRVAGIAFALVVAAPQFARIIRYAGLEDVFPIFRDRRSALAHLESPSP
jgi:anti-anti-sigma factor